MKDRIKELVEKHLSHVECGPTKEERKIQYEAANKEAFLQEMERILKPFGITRRKK